MILLSWLIPILIAAIACEMIHRLKDSIVLLAIVIEGAASDDRLRWSEVCWAASLMADRLREGQYQVHGIIPVSIYRYTDCYLHLLT
jgi:hypothetical protein